MLLTLVFIKHISMLVGRARRSKRGTSLSEGGKGLGGRDLGRKGEVD